MCLTVKKDSTVKVKPVDITVYKLGYPKTLFSIGRLDIGKDDKTFIPICRMDFIYVANVLQPKVELIVKEIDTNASPLYFIEEGYHAFISLNEYVAQYSKQMYKQTGFKNVVGKFIIPANTKYYLQDNEIVASQIIYKGLL